MAQWLEFKSSDPEVPASHGWLNLDSVHEIRIYAPGATHHPHNAAVPPQPAAAGDVWQIVAVHVDRSASILAEAASEAESKEIVDRLLSATGSVIASLKS